MGCNILADERLKGEKLILQDIADGQRLTLEVVWENVTYTVDAVAVGKNDTGILVLPLPDQDEQMQIIRQNIRRLNFIVYAIDDASRVSWKNVKVYPMTYKDKIYFACGTNPFNARAENSERRNDARFLLDVEGEVSYDDGQAKAIIHDVSDSGISFIVSSDIEFSNTKVYVNFKDVVNDNDFNISEAVRIVRSVDFGEKRLYGCRLMKQENDYLTYTYMKKMFQKKGKDKKEEVGGNENEQKD